MSCMPNNLIHSDNYSMFSSLELEFTYLVPFCQLTPISYTDVKSQSYFKNYDHIGGGHVYNFKECRIWGQTVWVQVLAPLCLGFPSVQRVVVRTGYS